MKLAGTDDHTPPFQIKLSLFITHLLYHVEQDESSRHIWEPPPHDVWLGNKGEDGESRLRGDLHYTWQSKLDLSGSVGSVNQILEATWISDVSINLSACFLESTEYRRVVLPWAQASRLTG